MDDAVADSKIMELPIAKGDRVKIDVELSDSDLSRESPKSPRFTKEGSEVDRSKRIDEGDQS